MDSERLDYWSEWQKAPLSVYDSWVSCWKYLNPIWILIYRALVVAIMTFLLCKTLATVASAHGCWTCLKTTTNRNDLGNGFLRRDLEGNESNQSSTESNKFWDVSKLQKIHHERKEMVKTAGFGGYLLQIIYQTSAGAAVLTDIVFWCLLVPFPSSDNFKVDLIAGCMHSLNLVFLLLDTALNSRVSMTPISLLVRPGLFRDLELFIHCVPVGSSCVWCIDMVALRFSQALNPMGTSLVLSDGSGSHPLL
ncbi:hypothetical protein C5167_016037 [Papaver somniferum]|nr:hypothetical protein C5167_016037 [Papaver somniferum]